MKEAGEVFASAIVEKKPVVGKECGGVMEYCEWECGLVVDHWAE